MSDRRLRPHQIAAHFDVSRASVSNWARRYSDFPEADEAGTRSLEELERWIAETHRALGMPADRRYSKRGGKGLDSLDHASRNFRGAVQRCLRNGVEPHIIASITGLPVDIIETMKEG